MLEKKQRSCNLDVIRIFAFLMVVSVHFFWNGNFYGQNINTPYMIFPILIRNLSMVCVPLFLLLSGYLLKGRTVSKGFYCKLIPTVGIYLLASLACMAYAYLNREEGFSLSKSLWGIFSFTTAPYSWYIEMYIGLFLMIPFFNIAYGKCSERGKKILVLTALISTALPSVLNIWRPTDLSWWLRPGSSEEYYEIFPNQWESLYPITFYFLGAYLRDFPPKLKPLPTFFLLVGVCSIGAVFSYYRTYGYLFHSSKWTAYQSALVTSQAVLTFHFFNSLDLSRVSERWRKVLARLSSWVLGAYLCSSIFDSWLYPILLEKQPVFLKSFIYYPIMVIVVSICSMLLSAVLNLIYDIIETAVKKCLASKKVPQ